LADSEDILPHYQDEWCDKVLEIKKWNEKKEKIEELVTAASVPKIKAGVQTALLAALKKLINDSNVMVSQTAVKAAGSLAKGLRSDFTGSKSLVGVILLRFKEKRQAYLEELHNTLEAFIQCSSLDEIYEEVCSTYSDKAPNIKKNTSIFLEKAIRVTYIDPLQKIGKDLCSKINKLTDDSNPEVRDTALTVIGVLKGRLGETFMGKCKFSL
jgi:cytoskeleton-associated protein 5